MAARRLLSCASNGLTIPASRLCATAGRRRSGFTGSALVRTHRRRAPPIGPELGRGADRERRSAALGAVLPPRGRTRGGARRRRRSMRPARSSGSGSKTASRRSRSGVAGGGRAAGRRRLCAARRGAAVRRGALAAWRRRRCGVRCVSRRPSRAPGAAGADRRRSRSSWSTASRRPAAHGALPGERVSRRRPRRGDRGLVRPGAARFRRNAVVLPDGSEIAGIEVSRPRSTPAPPPPLGAAPASARPRRCCARR